MERIDATHTVHHIIKTHPKAKEAMIELGLDQINKAAVLNTVGRVMTLKKGLASRGIDPQKAKTVFAKHGITLEGF